jgi:hypothetical protein
VTALWTPLQKTKETTEVDTRTIRACSLSEREESEKGPCAKEKSSSKRGVRTERETGISRPSKQAFERYSMGFGTDFLKYDTALSTAKRRTRLRRERERRKSVVSAYGTEKGSFWLAGLSFTFREVFSRKRPLRPTSESSWNEAMAGVYFARTNCEKKTVCRVTTSSAPTISLKKEPKSSSSRERPVAPSRMYFTETAEGAEESATMRRVPLEATVNSRRTGECTTKSGSKEKLAAAVHPSRSVV